MMDTGRPASERPLVSVVIPTYYRNDSLRAAIESVADQTYGPIETIVVDGSGEDHAAEVTAEYDVRHHPQTEDRGAHVARSAGAELANGAYISFLDDDDRFRPEKTRRQMDVIRSHEKVGVVYCGKQTDSGRTMRPDPRVQGEVLEYALKFQMTPSHPSTMLIDGEVIADMLPFVNRHGADDLGMKIELAQRTQFGFVDESLVVIGDSQDSLGGSFENIEGRKQLLETYSDLYERFPPEVERTARAYTHLLNAELTLNDYSWSWRAIREALLACYRIPGLRSSFLGFFLASLLGRPGRNLGRYMYFEYLLGEEVRGKLA